MVAIRAIWTWQKFRSGFQKMRIFVTLEVEQQEGTRMLKGLPGEEKLKIPKEKWKIESYRKDNS